MIYCIMKKLIYIVLLKKGEEARNSISRLLDNGLNTAVTAIKNADSEDIVIDKNGLRARLYDDINDYYAPEQLGILHIFAVSR